MIKLYYIMLIMGRLFTISTFYLSFYMSEIIYLNQSHTGTQRILQIVICSIFLSWLIILCVIVLDLFNGGDLVSTLTVHNFLYKIFVGGEES